MIDCRKNKELKVGDEIYFYIGQSIKSGVILEKEYMSKGDIGFLIQLKDGKFCRVKHRKLDLIDE